MGDSYVVVGAGPVGAAVADRLVARGDSVRVVTRSARPIVGSAGTIESVAADASDAERLSTLAGGARALFNCANPGNYTQWAQAWPPLAASLLTAAERTGATLVTAANLYPYGPVDDPMVEGQPDLATDDKGRMRAGMWAEAKRRHDAGRIRAVEIRASDYMGAGVGANGHIPRHVPAALRGKTAWVIGSPDLPHTWTDVSDMGRALVAAADTEETWGRVWHAPSSEPRTQREALTDVLAAVGKSAVPVRGTPQPVLGLVGRFVPLVRELNEMSYMFRRPYVMDSAVTSEALGFTASPWHETCHRTATGN